MNKTIKSIEKIFNKKLEDPKYTELIKQRDKLVELRTKLYSQIKELDIKIEKLDKEINFFTDHCREEICNSFFDYLNQEFLNTWVLTVSDELVKRYKFIKRIEKSLFSIYIDYTEIVIAKTEYKIIPESHLHINTFRLNDDIVFLKWNKIEELPLPITNLYLVSQSL